MPPFPAVRPEDVSVVVVEDGDKVVASMTVLRATHFEGLWIDPEYRNAGVVRGLIEGGWEMAARPWVFAGAADDRMRSILDRIGAVKIPMDTYVLPLGG